MVFNALSSDAHRGKLTSTTGNDSTIVIEQKIGDVDYQRFGRLFIEKRGSKFFVTFPLFLHTNGNDCYSSINDTIPVGSPLYLTLSNGVIIKSIADRNTDFTLHYLWRYNIYESVSNNGHTMAMPEGYPTDFGKYMWHDDNKMPMLGYNDNTYDVCGTSYMVKFEFTRSDMLALSKNRILNGHARKGNQIIFIPMKKKQSRRIKKSISALLRN